MKYIFARSTELGTSKWAYIAIFNNENMKDNHLNFTNFIRARDALVRRTTPVEKSILNVDFVAEVEETNFSTTPFVENDIPTDAFKPSLDPNSITKNDLFYGGEGMVVDLYCSNDGSFKIHYIERDKPELPHSITDILSEMGFDMKNVSVRRVNLNDLLGLPKKEESSSENIQEENQQYSETMPQPKRIPFTGEIIGQFGDNTILKQKSFYYIMDCYGDVSKITLPVD